MWEALVKKYEDKDLQGVNFSRKKYFNSKQGANESVEDFIDRVINSDEELEAAGLIILEHDVILTILQGLLPSYENFVQCLTVNKSLQDIDLDDIVAALVSEEKRRSELKTSDKKGQDEQIFHTKAKF